MVKIVFTHLISKCAKYPEFGYLTVANYIDQQNRNHDWGRSATVVEGDGV